MEKCLSIILICMLSSCVNGSNSEPTGHAEKVVGEIGKGLRAEKSEIRFKKYYGKEGGKEIQLYYQFSDSNSIDYNGATSITATSFVRKMGEEYLSTYDTVRVLFDFGKSINERSFAVKRLFTINKSLTHIKKFMDRIENDSIALSLVDTSLITNADILAFKQALTQFRSIDATELNEKLVKYEFHISLDTPQKEPITFFWIDYENKSSVMHLEFIVSEKNPIIMYFSY